MPAKRAQHAQIVDEWPGGFLLTIVSARCALAGKDARGPIGCNMEHITDILDNQPFADLTDTELSAIRAHGASCAAANAFAHSAQVAACARIVLNSLSVNALNGVFSSLSAM